MNTDEVHEIVLEVFQAIFPNLSIDESLILKREDYPHWDSMAHVSLISALEGEFDIAISLERATNIQSFDQCIGVVNSLVNT